MKTKCSKPRYNYYALGIIMLILSQYTTQFAYAAEPAVILNGVNELASVNWIHGSENCEGQVNDSNYQEWQQVQFETQSFVFRQNKCSNYEGPFVYLFIGQNKALLIDSGATIDGGVKLVNMIRAITNLPIVVAHSHGHGDHRLGDDAFRAEAGVTVVNIGATAVQEYFGFSNWPNESVSFDLGGRFIDMLPIPGHSDDDIAYYDVQTQVVVTGDTLYPGRLYVRDWAEYSKSISRLADWVNEKSISSVLGTHIEMSDTPNVDYPIRTTYQPNEHQLPLGVSDINVLRDTVLKLQSPERTPLGSFIIWPN
jgi:hydroxyacylglutathione hydrolase